MMWAAGFLASLGSITYPAISAFVSIHSNVDTQGLSCLQPHIFIKFLISLEFTLCIGFSTVSTFT